MIGRAYRNADDTRRVRVWQRAGGDWDIEVVIRWPSGGWYIQCAPADEDEEVYRDEYQALLNAGDYIGDSPRDPMVALDVAELTDGWPGLPPPYETPAGAPAIEVGQLWRRGRQVTCVEDVQPGNRHGVLITTRNLISAKESVGRMIRGRRAAAWTYNEEDFRAKFKLECGAPDTEDRERPATKSRRSRRRPRG